MPKLFHFPWLRRLLNRGVNTDVLPELMPEGTAREAVNVRPGSITGAAGGAEAVKGEELSYPSPGGDGYVLIGSCSCNNRVVEFWASSLYDTDPVLYAPIVRIDGVVVAQSRNIPYVYDRPLQIAVVDDFFGTSIAANESSDGVVRGRGIVYPADHNSIPLYWDITQLVDFANSGNLGYFGDNYQVGINSVGLFNTPEFPIHTRNVEVGGLGLKTGQYQYALRYVTPQGDRTNIGPWTPLITVPLKQSERRPWEQSHYPGATTIGGPAGLDTPYGVEIKFRVDNVFGFQKVQVVRRKYNDADNIGQIEMVGEILIDINENSIRTFLDPSDAIAEPEVIPADEEAIKIVAINKPKTVEYSDRRLTYANFETFPKDASSVQFIDRGEGTMFPVTQGVCTRYFDPSYNPNGANPRENESNYTYWNDGYSDPVNNTYLKSFMRGERYGIGLMFWNQYTEQSFVKEVPLAGGSTNDGYLFPNRRDRRTGKSFLYSDGYQGVDSNSLVQATTDLNGTDTGVVGPTFEVFTQGAVAKNWVPVEQSSALAPWSQYGFINRVNFPSSSFNPFGPTDPTTNGDESRLSQSPNKQGYRSLISGIATSPSTYTGNIWAARSYALGAAIEGVQSVPDGTTVISVMRTEPARRVIAQGIACWSKLERVENTSQEYRKSLNQVDVMIPDFKNAIVDQTIIDLFESNPNAFKIQFVSPLGFFSESYSYDVVDLLSYAGIQWDDAQTVNNGIAIDAYQGQSTPAQYVGYGSWRSNASIGSNAWSSSDGNKLFDILDVESITQIGQTRWRVTLGEDVYEQATATGGSNDGIVRNFQEPWYAINIVVDEAVIPNDQVDKYIETGYHIKTESCIGITPSASQQPGSYQDFPLLNERLGDVYANSGFVQIANPGSFGDAQFNRYVYVDDGASVKPWLCVTDNSYANTNALFILAALSATGSFTMPDGVTIYGVYSIVGTDDWSSTAQRFRTGTVRFGQWISTLNGTPSQLNLTMPADGCRVLVRYNNNEPIRFFGGDCTVSHSLDALFNGFGYQSGQVNDQGAIESSLVSNADLLNIPGLANPYNGYVKADGYEMMRVAPSDSGQLTYAFAPAQIPNYPIRQWVVYWNAEQRSAIRYYSGSADTQGPYEWPRMGYLMQWTTFFSTTVFNATWAYPSVGIAPGLSIDVNAKTGNGYGGFLLDCNVNPSYTKQAPITGFGVPFVSSGGSFTEKFYFPTGLIASLEFDQLVQDSPNLRTFLDLNLKTVSEENGEIKTIASALAGGGRNLYAWTDSGVVRILTAKNILTGASGEVISTQAISNYWGEEMWLSRNIGVPDQMWQFFVKGFAPAGDGYADSFFWADRNSVYRMVGDNIMDIGREKFLAYLLPILREYPRGYVPGTSGFYNRKYNEAWMSLNLEGDTPGTRKKNLLVYNPEINAWNGRYTYQFDGYTQSGNTIYGHRNLETYMLDQGDLINGSVRSASITVPMAVDRNNDIDTFKEFIRWRVVGSKPDKIQILDPDFVVMCEMPNPLVPVNPLWVKEYDGWEGWADRTLASYPPGDRKLPQKRYFYLRLVWNTAGDKNATSLSGQLKPIK